MSQQKTRLFVVIDPTADHQLALVKASLIAKLGDCHIHAFLCIHQEMGEGGGYASRRDFKRQTLIKARERLDELMQPCKLSGLSYTTEVVWNSRWVPCLTRAIEKSACDLVIKSSFHHTRARRFFSKTADYHLMHHCACPILFTHQDQEWKSDRILACLDLESDDPQHARLNNVILRDARAFAKIVGLDLYIGCAYVNAIDGDYLALETRGYEAERAQLGELYRLAPERVVLRQGSVIEALHAICEETDPSIVIIGTMARTGIRGKLIGNTAEKLIDIVTADLLTVN
ncbi:MAG: universal stress protein [Gammaproteobacteria bacterium]|nr:universal stress protein [Gammaproteobacteria bacterium]